MRKNWSVHRKSFFAQRSRYYLPKYKNSDVVMFLACFILAATPLVHSTCHPSCYFHEEPADTAVIEGNNARFNCAAEIDIYHYVDWNCGGLVLTPWPENIGHSSSRGVSAFPKEYTYPDDADYSIGTYDIVIKNITWKKHNQMKFACQISSERMRTRFATLAVLVPPEIEMHPLRKDGLVEVDASVQEVNLTCLTNFATPMFKVEWIIDGMILQNSTNVINVKRHRRQGKLIQIKSTANILMHQREIKTWTVGPSSVDSVGNDQPRERQSHRRQQLESHYLVVHHVSCQIVHSELESIKKTSTVFVVFERNRRSVVGNYTFGSGNLPVQWYHVMIGVAVIAFVTGIITVVAVRRKRAAIKEDSDENRDREHGLSDSKNVFRLSSGDSPAISLHNLQRDAKQTRSKMQSSQSDIHSSPLTISTTVSDLDDCSIPTLPSPMTPFSSIGRTRLNGRRSAKFARADNPFHRDSWNPWITDREPNRYHEAAAPDTDHYCRMKSLKDQYSTMQSSDAGHQPFYYSPWSLPISASYENISVAVRPRIVMAPSSFDMPFSQRIMARPEVFTSESEV